MKKVVYYFSKAGNTKLIAEAIATELGVNAEPIDNYQKVAVDVLFIGGSLKADGIDAKLKKFLLDLSPELIGNLVCFGTSASGNAVLPAIKGVLKDSKLNIVAESFVCKGKFLLMNRGKPDAEDCANAKVFASRVINSLKI